MKSLLGTLNQKLLEWSWGVFASAGIAYSEFSDEVVKITISVAGLYGDGGKTYRSVGIA